MATIMGCRRAALLLPGSLRARLARGAFWSFVGAAVARGMAFAASVVCGRVLGTSGFGELGMIQSTVGFFGVFAGLGLGVPATKHVAEFRESDPRRAARALKLSSVTATGQGQPLL